MPRELHPVLRRVYRGRGIHSPAELDLGLAMLLQPNGLKGLDTALELLREALERQARILIVGDYDADGATSTALALLALRSFGYRNLDYLVPNRFDFGYGLTPEIVELAQARGPELIITVDNGIASVAGVARARELGIRVLVTDHHLPGEQLPEAAAIVNPNQPGDAFSSKHLAGVGVIFYLMAALRSALQAQGTFAAIPAPPSVAEWLDLVALGTVADLVPLDRNNRILVEQGLRRIRSGRCRPGIAALLRIAGRDLKNVVSSDLAFAAGPRLNAAGRLEDMSLGIECLLTEDSARALELAAELDALNRSRREIEAEMQDQALSWLQQAQLDQAEELPVGLCLYQPEWHQGVVGILASRIRERYHRPAVCFADGGEGLLKGSARSVPGLHMRDLLAQLATAHPDLLERFGGHAMAAGLTLKQEHYERFSSAFAALAAQWLDEQQLEGALLSDGELAASDLQLDLARQLRFAGPWGQGCPEPLFDGEFDVVHQRQLGGKHIKLRLSPAGDSMIIDGIAFNQAEAGQLPARVHLAYRLDVNEYQGQVRPQLIVESIQSTS